MRWPEPSLLHEYIGQGDHKNMTDPQISELLSLRSFQRRLPRLVTIQDASFEADDFGQVEPAVMVRRIWPNCYNMFRLLRSAVAGSSVYCGHRGIQSCYDNCRGFQRRLNICGNAVFNERDLKWVCHRCSFNTLGSQFFR